MAAEFADSPEWVVTGSPTAAHWLAIIADVEPCTTREWIRIGRKLVELPAIAEPFETRAISYSKVRTLTRLAAPDNEHELLAIATTTTAADLGRALAAWLHRNCGDEDLAEYHQQQRSVKWRTEPDGMVSFWLRLPPLLAGILIAFLTSWVMRTRPAAPTNEGNTAGEWPTVAQQHADALSALVTEGAGPVDTEVVVHVRGDGNTLDDRTPLPDSVVADLIPTAFIIALVHDAKEVPPETYVGLVSFHGIATVEVPPTTDRAAVRSAILGLQLDEATAIGEAIIASIDALESFAVDFDGEPPPARIVLLSDGETTVGRPDAAAIDRAQMAGIAVSTIAFGTDAGTIDDLTQMTRGRFQCLSTQRLSPQSLMQPAVSSLKLRLPLCSSRSSPI